MQNFFSKTLNRFLGMDTGELVQSRAARDVIGSLILHVTGRLLQIGLAVLLARILSLKEFGLFTLTMSWVLVLVVPSMVGTDQFTQRELAVAKTRKEWGKAKAMLRWSTLAAILVSLLISTVASCWILVHIPPDNPDRYAFLIGFTLIPLTTLLLLLQAQLRGWGAILAGQIPGVILRRILFGVLLLAASAFLSSIALNAAVALVFQTVATVLALGVTVFLKFRYLRVPHAAETKPESWRWLRLSSRFTLLSGLIILNSQIGILIVGALLGKAETGLFSVAVKGAGLLTVGFAAVSLALAPRMAAFYSERKQEKLQSMITRAYMVVALITLPVFLLFIIAGNVFLSVFGVAFLKAWPALIILSLGQFLSVLSGPAGTMLNMAGHEGVTALGAAVSVFVTIGANIILIPLMGINGAAIATVLGMITWNIVLVFLCYRRVGVWTPVFGISLVKRGISDS